MIEKSFTIKNAEGLHARPAGVLAKTAGAFTSTVELVGNGKTINAKSIMSVMGLGLTKDTGVTLRISGADELVAMEKIEQLFNNNFQL